MPRLLALNAQWRRNPPLQLMIKAFLGIKENAETSGDSPPPALTQTSDFEE